MHLPKIYEYFTEQFPEVFRDFRQLGKTCRQSGPLDPKVQNLVNLGVAIGIVSRGAIMSQTRKALEAGATEAEIRHTALMALTTIGFPNTMAALGWINEVLERERP